MILILSLILLRSELVTWLLLVAAGIVILLLIREANTWYWKINHIVSLLEEISAKISGESGGEGRKWKPSATSKPEEPAKLAFSNQWKCPKCHNLNSEASEKCLSCKAPRP